MNRPNYIDFCGYCNKVLINPDYIDRGMWFCDPTCAMKQAEAKFKEEFEKLDDRYIE
jgi:hypothetical protein